MQAKTSGVLPIEARRALRFWSLEWGRRAAHVAPRRALLGQNKSSALSRVAISTANFRKRPTSTQTTETLQDARPRAAPVPRRGALRGAARAGADAAPRPEHVFRRVARVLQGSGRDGRRRHHLVRGQRTRRHRLRRPPRRRRRGHQGRDVWRRRVGQGRLRRLRARLGHRHRGERGTRRLAGPRQHVRARGRLVHQDQDHRARAAQGAHGHGGVREARRQALSGFDLGHDGPGAATESLPRKAWRRRTREFM